MHFFFIFLELKKTFFRSSANAIKLFSQLSLTMKQNKLERLFLTSFFTVHYKGWLTSHLLARYKCSSLLCFISKIKKSFRRFGQGRFLQIKIPTFLFSIFLEEKKCLTFGSISRQWLLL